MYRTNFSDFPVRFTEIITGLYADAGTQWLADLPKIVNKIAENWSLAVEQPFPNLSYNFVAPCVCADGSRAVLKIGFCAENSEIFNEAKFLKIFDGEGTVKLLRFDKNYCALLLERLIPGENLTRLCQTNDVQATSIAIGVMRKIWRTPPKNHDFPMLEKWTDGLKRAAKTEFPIQFIRKAQDYFEELNAPSKQKFLLHGDLHHENILSAQREPYLIIDPKGIVGDIGYEISVYLNNQANWVSGLPDSREKLNRCVNQFAEAFEIEPRNLRKWAFAQQVLGVWWTLEDNGKNWKNDLALAEIWEV